jgi:hypothetical protein
MRTRTRRRKPITPAEPITGYIDQKSRLDYLRQKMAAEGRMRQFDNYPPEFRQVYDAAGTINNATVCWRAGCRTFEDTERAMAGVWDGR